MEFSSEMEVVATALKKYHIPVTQLDCATERAQCERHRPGPLSFLRVYRYGIPTVYRGTSMKAADIVSYMRREYTTWVPEVTALNLEEFKEADKVVVVAFLATSAGAPAAAFSAVKEKHHHRISFGLSTDPEAAAAAQVDVPAMISFNDLEDWINELAMPMLGELSELTVKYYVGYSETSHSHRPVASIVLDPTDESTEALISSLMPVASKYRSAMVFVWIDAHTFKNNTYRFYGLSEPKWPSFVIGDTVTKRYFPYDQSKTVDAMNVEEWFKQYLGGHLVSAPRTQPIREDQTASVYELVGAEFDSVVFDDSKDVFIAFHGNLRDQEFNLFMPTWHQLGDRHAAFKKTLTIAKINAEANDLPSSVGEMTPYPALKFKPAGTRKLIDYKGNLSFDNLVSFLEKHVANSLEIPGLTYGHGDQLPLGGVDSAV
ncbi:hypothetical protein C8R44DRAFT_843241 [Mycena epipterygia]|nr:hypothetical protein C8R44DRAFT_843241 [Mycena epipterygia]